MLSMIERFFNSLGILTVLHGGTGVTTKTGTGSVVLNTAPAISNAVLTGPNATDPKVLWDAGLLYVRDGADGFQFLSFNPAVPEIRLYCNMLSPGDGQGFIGDAGASYSQIYAYDHWVSRLNFFDYGDPATDRQLKYNNTDNALKFQDNGSVVRTLTWQGNTFNGISQLVKLDGAGALPALDATALTNVDDAAYTAASAVDWNGSAPATIAAALDRLAALVGPVP